MGNNDIEYDTYSVNDTFIMSVPKKSDITLATGEVDYDTKFEEESNKYILSSIQNLQGQPLYSVYPKGDSSSNSLTPERIDSLSDDIRNRLDNLIEVNKIIRSFITTDDIIGKTQEAIETNVNTDIKLSYNDFSKYRNKKKQLDEAKSIIEKFNKQIHLKQIIKECIPLTFAEGNYICYLRYDSTKSHYVVDRYPLGMVRVSDYKYGGKPVLEIDVRALEAKIRKTYLKDRNNEPLYFSNVENEIKNTFPPEVYKAYKKREQYARLNTDNASIIRIGSLGQRYGISPIFKALKSALMLRTYENADYINTKAKAKKIIFQKMRKESMGKDYNQKGIHYTLKAHDDLMKAWKNKTVVYTAIPQVESIEYIEPKVEDTNAEKINAYRSKEITALGIGFADSNVGNFSVANISLDQLMKTINSISQQLEEVINGWYAVLFKNEEIDESFLPEVQILDSEIMSFEMKKDLAKLLYTTFNGSLETSLAYLDINVNDEKAKREKENPEGYEEIFKARQTSYTVTKDTDTNDTGRPADSDNKDKQAYDFNKRN
jgi:hypothetical protein